MEARDDKDEDDTDRDTDDAGMYKLRWSFLRLFFSRSELYIICLKSLSLSTNYNSYSAFKQRQYDVIDWSLLPITINGVGSIIHTRPPPDNAPTGFSRDFYVHIYIQAVQMLLHTVTQYSHQPTSPPAHPHHFCM